MPQAVVVKKENDAGFVELARLGRAHESVLHLIDEIIHTGHHEANGQGEVGKTSQVDGFLRSVLKLDIGCYNVISIYIIQRLLAKRSLSFSSLVQDNVCGADSIKHSRFWVNQFKF